MKVKNWGIFHLNFENTDSLNYSIVVMPEDFPARKSVGFAIYNKYYYWLGDVTPPNLILGKEPQEVVFR